MTWTRRKFIKTGLLSSFAYILLDSIWIEKFFIETKTFCLGKSTDENFDLKIIQISDLHLQTINYQLEKLIDNINEQHPDLILFTGDSIDKRQNIDVLN